MAPRFYIHDGADWVDVTGRVNLREPPTLNEKAEEGAMGFGQLILDDRAMDLVVDPFTPFVATETESESDDQVWAAGMLTGRKVVRTTGGSRDPIGRLWVCEAVDQNEKWHRRVLKGADANRDEETDNERATWLLGQMSDWNLVTDDTTYVGTGAESGNLDAEDFRLRYPDEVMGDAAEAKSKNWWLQRQGTIDDLTTVAWWGHDANSQYSSPLYLTNDLTVITEYLTAIREQNSDVWPLRMDHGLRCIPERMYSGVGARHRSGRIYRRDSGTAAIIGVRDGVMAGTDQKSKAVTVNRALRYLDDFGAEEFRVEARVRLPWAKVTKLRAGMRVPVSMTHWPFGLDEWTWWRVVAVGVTPAPAGKWYDVDLELASTGDAASEPPDPPFAGAAFIALLNSNASNDDNPVKFAATGDGPPGGWYEEPRVSAVFDYTEGSTPFRRIDVNANVVVRIEAAVNWAGVTAPGTYILNVLVNGEVVATASETVEVGGFHTLYVHADQHDVELHAGDQIWCEWNPDASTPGIGNSGINSTFLRVGRGTHNWNFGTITWEGP